MQSLFEGSGPHPRPAGVSSGSGSLDDSGGCHPLPVPVPSCPGCCSHPELPSASGVRLLSIWSLSRSTATVMDSELHKCEDDVKVFFMGQLFHNIPAQCGCACVCACPGSMGWTPALLLPPVSTLDIPCLVCALPCGVSPLWRGCSGRAGQALSSWRPRQSQRGERMW